MAHKTAIVEVTVEYRVVMDEHGNLIGASPVRSPYYYEEEAIRMADGVEFEEEVD